MWPGSGRRRRARELERRLQELDHWDRLYGLGGMPPGHERAGQSAAWRHHSPDGSAPIRVFDQRRTVPGGAPARRRSRVGALVVPLLLVGGAAAGGYVYYPEQARDVLAWAEQGGRSFLGLPAEGGHPTAEGGHPAAEDGHLAAEGAVMPDAPGEGPLLGDGTPPPDQEVEEDPRREAMDRILAEVVADQGFSWAPQSGRRILPAVEATTTGSYAFLAVQPGTGAPVGFSPCGSIPVAVNPAGGPEGFTGTVTASLERLGSASGLHLELVGETGDSWADVPHPGAPVLVSWATEDEVPELAGDIAGLGGAVVMVALMGESWAASGRVVLDREDLTTPEAVDVVLDHELAHVLGLDHVDDPQELMSAYNTGQAGFGPGDLAGLAALGAITCP